MAQRDIHNHLGFSLSLSPAVYTSDQNGTGVDVRDHGAVEALFVFGTTGDTLSGSIYVTPVLQESDDDSTYNDVAAADMLGTLTVVDSNSEDDTIQKVGYIGSKRYVRTKFDFTGTHSTGIELCGVVVKGNAALAPVA